MSMRKDLFYAPIDTPVRPQRNIKRHTNISLGSHIFLYKRQILFTLFSFNFANWLTKIINLISNFKVLVVELDR